MTTIVVAILRGQEIRSYEALTRLANAPKFIKEEVNLRGVIVSIVDLRLMLAQTTPQFLPNWALAAATQLFLGSPARASHFSMATL